MRGGWFFVWWFVVLFSSCRVLCCWGVVLVVPRVVLFVLCVCVCDLFLFTYIPYIHSRKQRNKALTLAHAQTIHYTSN